MSPSTPRMELEGSKDISCLKYYNTLEWESRFTLRLNTAENIDYIEKWFKRKLSIIKFPTKNSVETYSNLPQELSLGLQRFDIIILLVLFENELGFQFVS